MSGWTEVIAGGGLITLLGIVLSVQRSSVADLKKRLYRSDGITVFLPRKEAEKMEDRIITKIDELKNVVEGMDQKRETAKEENQRDLRNIDSRLATIEAKLPARAG
ncbi:MAG: hypothetical protein ABIG63_19675 [Chloroflexota bacterium]